MYRAYQFGSKVCFERFVGMCRTIREHGKGVAMTNGCFSMLHAGHLKMIREASLEFSPLIVVINSAESILRLKGQRPIIEDEDRAAMLSSLRHVWHVVVSDDDSPERLITLLKPRKLFKGGDTLEIVGADLVRQFGGEAVRLTRHSCRSSTEILNGTLTAAN